MEWDLPLQDFSGAMSVGPSQTGFEREGREEQADHVEPVLRRSERLRAGPRDEL